MKKILSVLFIIFIFTPVYVSAFAPWGVFTGAVSGGATPTPTPTPDLLDEDFSGTGTPSGWTPAGATVDFDDVIPSTSIDAMSLIDEGSDPSAISAQWSAQSTVYFKLVLHCSDSWQGDATIMQARDASANNAFYIQSRGGPLRFYHGSAYAAGASLSTGTTYYFWGSYTAGSGSDGTISVTYNTSDDKGGASAYASLSNGTSTYDTTYFRFLNYSGGSSSYYWGYVGASTTDTF